MRTTNIAALRNHLTRYLKEVRAGEEIVVRDRQLPFARIVPLAHNDETEDSALVASGLMRRAERALPASFWPSSDRDAASRSEEGQNEAGSARSALRISPDATSAESSVSSLCGSGTILANGSCRSRTTISSPARTSLRYRVKWFRKAAIFVVRTACLQYDHNGYICRSETIGVTPRPLLAHNQATSCE